MSQAEEENGLMERLKESKSKALEASRVKVPMGREQCEEMIRHCCSDLREFVDASGEVDEGIYDIEKTRTKLPIESECGDSDSDKDPERDSSSSFENYSIMESDSNDDKDEDPDSDSSSIESYSNDEEQEDPDSGSSSIDTSDDEESGKHEDPDSDIDSEVAIGGAVSENAAERVAETGLSSSKAEYIMLCQMYGSHRLLRIKLLGSLFKDAEIMGHDAIKAHVWSFLNEPLTWQVQIDNGWTDCDSVIQQALNDAVAQGLSCVQLRARSWDYSYNIERHCQTNLSSRRTRSLRCRNPWMTIGTALSQLAAPCKEPQWQFSTGFGWANCSDDIQALLADTEARGETQVVMYPHQFDLSLMKQTNCDSGRERNLRKAVPQVGK
jgi:hypothetical protein